MQYLSPRISDPTKHTLHDINLPNKIFVSSRGGVEGGELEWLKETHMIL